MKTLDPQIIAAIITTSGAIINALIALISRQLRKRKGSTTATPAEGGNDEKKDNKIKNRQKLFTIISVVLLVISIILIAKILVTQPAITDSSNLLFSGWHVWPGDAIEATVNGNTVTLNGKASMAGYKTTDLNAKAMRKKTVTLEIRNAEASEWYEDRMIKITVNDNNLTLHPDNITNLIGKEYAPVTSLIILTLPRNFDGQLGFIFYNADLRDLQITATYR